MDNNLLNEISNSINSNPNLNKDSKEMEAICDFIADLVNLNSKFPDIKLDNLINNLKTLKFEQTKDITEKCFSEYDKNTNTIYIHNLSRRENLDGEKKYHMYKSLLECSITKVTQYKTYHGILDKSNKNIALNNALEEKILELMLNESRHNFLDIEMKFLHQIEEIIGIEPLLNSLFTANYKNLENAFVEYNIPLSNLSENLDKIMEINLGKAKITESDKNLVKKVQDTLIDAYMLKFARENNPNYDTINFEGNMITINDSKYGIENMFDNIPSNTDKFKIAIEGCKKAMIYNDSTKTI